MSNLSVNHPLKIRPGPQKSKHASGLCHCDRWFDAKIEHQCGTSVEPVWKARAHLGTREAAVVFVESAQRYLIITVEWTDEA